MYGLLALNSQVLNIIMEYYGFVIHKFTITCVDNGIFDEMYTNHISSGMCLLFTIMYGRKGVVDVYFQIHLLNFLNSWWLELGDIRTGIKSIWRYFVCTGIDIELIFYYQETGILYTYQHLLISKNKATLLVWIILGYKQVKLVSQLPITKKAICHIMGGCRKSQC